MGNIIVLKLPVDVTAGVVVEVVVSVVVVGNITV